MRDRISNMKLHRPPQSLMTDSKIDFVTNENLKAMENASFSVYIWVSLQQNRYDLIFLGCCFTTFDNLNCTD